MCRGRHVPSTEDRWPTTALGGWPGLACSGQLVKGRPLAELAREFNVKYAAVSLSTKRITEHMANDKRFRKRVLTQREALINILKT